MNLYSKTLHDQARTDRDAAWELSEAEVNAELRSFGMAASALHRANYREAERAMNRIPRIRPVPIPVEFATEIAARPWADAPTDEEGWIALTDFRRDVDGRIGSWSAQQIVGLAVAIALFFGIFWLMHRGEKMLDLLLNQWWGLPALFIGGALYTLLSIAIVGTVVCL